MFPRITSLRKKLVTIAMITATLTLILSNLAFISLEYYLGKKEVSQKLTILGEVIANQTSAALMFEDQPSLQNNLNALTADTRHSSRCSYKTRQNLFTKCLYRSTTQLHRVTD